jgi:hypothetical protein
MTRTSTFLERVEVSETLLTQIGEPAYMSFIELDLWEIFEDLRLWLMVKRRSSVARRNKLKEKKESKR